MQKQNEPVKYSMTTSLPALNLTWIGMQRQQLGFGGDM